MGRVRHVGFRYFYIIQASGPANFSGKKVVFLLFRYSILRHKYVSDRRISISGLIFKMTQSAIAVQYLSHRSHPPNTLPFFQKYPHDCCTCIEVF
jgi:hypothetical protein